VNKVMFGDFSALTSRVTPDLNPPPLSPSPNPIILRETMIQTLTFEDSTIPDADFEAMFQLAKDRIDLCKKKNEEYGSSWCKRGGAGAFFSVIRKTDRLETQARNRNYDLFNVDEDPNSTESLDETLLDTVAYYLLILEKRQAKRQMMANLIEQFQAADTYPIGASVTNSSNHQTNTFDISYNNGIKDDS